MLLVTAGCSCVLPLDEDDPGHAMGRFVVRSDVHSLQVIAARVGPLEEWSQRVARALGVDPAALPPTEVLVLSLPAAAKMYECMGTNDSTLRGFYSRTDDGQPLIVVEAVEAAWQNIAHELVHAYTDFGMRAYTGFEPSGLALLPRWKLEGLAYALAHSSGMAKLVSDDLTFAVPGCPVLTAAVYDQQKLLIGVSAWLAGREAQLPIRMAGALVRYGIESRGWEDLISLIEWEPDPAAFLGWLRGQLSQKDAIQIIILNDSLASEGIKDPRLRAQVRRYVASSAKAPQVTWHERFPPIE